MARVNASPVRVDEQAFGDPRIAMLGELAGYNAFEALGRMTHLWRWCTQRQTHVVAEATVRVMLGPTGVESILGAELGERVVDGIRVRGTHGRIEWPEELAAKRRAAGEASAARPRDDKGRLLPSKLPARAGRAGGVVVDNTIPNADSDAEESSKSPANVQQTSSTEPANTSAEPAQSTTRSRSGSGSEEEREADRSAPAPLTLVPDSPALPKPSRKRPKTRWPEGWSPEFVKPPDGVDPAFELERWRNYCQANDTMWVDWQAAWRNWLSNAQPRRTFGGTGPPNAHGPTDLPRKLNRL